MLLSIVTSYHLRETKPKLFFRVILMFLNLFELQYSLRWRSDYLLAQIVHFLFLWEEKLTKKGERVWKTFNWTYLSFSLNVKFIFCAKNTSDNFNTHLLLQVSTRICFFNLYSMVLVAGKVLQNLLFLFVILFIRTALRVTTDISTYLQHFKKNKMELWIVNSVLNKRWCIFIVQLVYFNTIFWNVTRHLSIAILL